MLLEAWREEMFIYVCRDTLEQIQVTRSHMMYSFFFFDISIPKYYGTQEKCFQSHFETELGHEKLDFMFFVCRDLMVAQEGLMTYLLSGKRYIQSAVLGLQWRLVFQTLFHLKPNFSRPPYAVLSKQNCHSYEVTSTVERK